MIAVKSGLSIFISKFFLVVVMLLCSSNTPFIFLHLLGALMSSMLCLPLAEAKLVLYVYFSPGLFPRLRVEFLNTSFVS